MARIFLTSIAFEILPACPEIFAKYLFFYYFRLKSKANLGLNPNLLKVVSRNVPSSAVSDGRKKKDVLADVVEKADGKRKKEKKEEKDDKFCKPGEENCTVYNIIECYSENSRPYIVASLVKSDLVISDVAQHGNCHVIFPMGILQKSTLNSCPLKAFVINLSSKRPSPSTLVLLMLYQLL